MKEGDVPALLVRREKNLFRQLDNLGGRRKACVVQPEGEMPDHALKAPTCENRDTSFSLNTARWVPLFRSCGKDSGYQF